MKLAESQVQYPFILKGRDKIGKALPPKNCEDKTRWMSFIKIAQKIEKLLLDN